MATPVQERERYQGWEGFSGVSSPTLMCLWTTQGSCLNAGSDSVGPGSSPRFYVLMFLCLQERIAKCHGTQCGFCTPGMVMSMYTLQYKLILSTIFKSNIRLRVNKWVQRNATGSLWDFFPQGLYEQVLMCTTVVGSHACTVGLGWKMCIFKLLWSTWVGNVAPFLAVPSS